MPKRDHGTVPAPANLIDALNDVRRAVRDQGPVPAHHRAVLRRHREEWPALWRALDRLILIGDTAALMADTTPEPKRIRNRGKADA